MKLTRLLVLLLVLGCAVSCEQNLLELEQYKKLVYLKSGEDHLLTYPFQMNDDVSRGFITVGSGGSMPLSEDLQVTLALDTPSLNTYNYRVYGNEITKYAQLVDQKFIASLNFKVILEKGVPSALKAVPVDLKVSSLSPDTNYIIPIKIESASNVEINPEKKYVLFKVGLENAYTSMASRSYKMKGLKQIGTGSVSTITTTKMMQPLGRNRVRIFPENLAYSTVLKDLEDKAIVLTIGSDNQVQISPFKNIELQITEPSSYNEATKEFILYYKYRLSPTAVWITVSETLSRVL